MAGGLMNLVSTGQQNIILNGNPDKTFWKTTYKRYTNFGKQNFRLDYEGTPTLNLTTESTFTFKVKRYADLLMDCYISLKLPNIWSPIMPPQTINNPDGTQSYTDWVPYQFQWIEFLGAQIINKISINCGNQKLQEYSGRYLLSATQRDVGGSKYNMFLQMIGHVAQMYSPGSCNVNTNGTYPNAYYTSNPAGAQPSIMGQTLYIPLGAWFNLQTVNAFPLVSLQYNELTISVTFRPIFEWFTIKDVMDYTNNYPIVQPNFNQYYMQFYRFLQTPPDETLGPSSYVDTRTNWNADINLNCTYCFLSNDESKLFAKNEQKYLIRQIYERPYYNITGQNKIDLESMGMVISWMFFFQRSDANLRNQWSNYTNWPYDYGIGVMPFPPTTAPVLGNIPNPNTAETQYPTLGPGVNPDGTSTSLYVSGVYNQQNIQTILVSLGILLDGQYRENMLPEGVYNYVEKFVRNSSWQNQIGLYSYNFCLDTASFSTQPSGAMNMSRFTSVQFEYTTISPPFDPYAQVLTICDPNTGDLVGINKPSWQIYDYNYNLYVMEERVNIITFVGGNAGLVYAT